ncbi:hypothetical protein HWV07_11985 [Natronomonas salina]|uniref:Sjogren's syndrome/scleroderma autoantigen 1 family protein n=1 Tax=Natronomonas salina TaxID=1710540 RepID=UPI0015B5D51F|nr:Sjogren's syndrome/scleroderma autoantigen 1 family protein [Natronomonas salina]QLD89706.1 hypothetical protein HWV07_11985 [Natronomonas salina]
MSEDFDREAEREKLREKYERDQAKREATEQMSELLLQGATMTNQHCPECHSPVFRYEGTEFCPTCQREVTEEGELAGEEGAEAPTGEGTPADAATNGEAAEAVEQDQEPVSGTPDPADLTPDEEASADGSDAGPTDAEQSSPSREDRPAETRPATTGERRPARVDPPARREEPRGGRETTAAEGGDLGEAEAALVREITSLTRRAEDTRDVGRKRDLFAAAREAAETLRELRRL